MDDYRSKNFIKNYTPINLDEIKLFNSVKMEDASEITKLSTPYLVSNYLYFKDFNSNKLDKEEIMFDINLSYKEMILELNKVNLEFSISEFLKRNKTQSILTKKYQKNNDDKINFLEQCIIEILDWYEETGYSFPESTSVYFARIKNGKKKNIKNKGGRPVNPNTAIQKTKLRNRFYHLNKDYKSNKALDKLEKEFPQFKRSTIQTYLKK
jgi:hypothetical protein